VKANGFIPRKFLAVTKPVCSEKKMPRRAYITQEEKAFNGFH
jgi:hypothetical protein